MKGFGGKKKPHTLISGERRGDRFIPIIAGREKGEGASRRREQRIQNSKDSSQLHPELLLTGSGETDSRSFLSLPDTSKALIKHPFYLSFVELG